MTQLAPLVSKGSFCKWKSKHNGISASDLKRLKDLEEENRRLKPVYANLSLEHAVQGYYRKKP